MKSVHKATTGDNAGRRPASPFPPASPADLPADVVLGRLRALGRHVTGSGPWMACCPAHADSRPSLSVTEADNRVLLLYCWAGCDTGDVLAALGLDFADLYPSLFARQFGTRRTPERLLARRGGSDDEGVRESSAEECERWARYMRARPASATAINQLAHLLKLPAASVRALGVGYDEGEYFWALPERDDRGRVVGVVRRDSGRCKQSVADGRRGLTVLDYAGGRPAGPLHVAEGASDAAALHAAGLYAVGRSAAVVGATERAWLTRLAGRHPRRRVIVVGDRDANGGVGERGARALAARLAEDLGRPVAWALPLKPFKDVRDQFVAGTGRPFRLCVRGVPS